MPDSSVRVPPQQPLSPRRGLLLRFSALLFVALGLRLLGIELQPLWWDEGFSVYFATESTPRLLELTSRDIHPPLYYLLLQGWYQLVGVGALQSRWLSVLLGVLALPLAWRVARDLSGRRAAGIAALLLALSPFHIYYSQEVRMYALMVVLALGAVVAWRRRAWVALGLLVLAGLHTQYYFVLMAAAIGALVVWELHNRQYSLRRPVTAMTVAVLGYIPWLVYALPRLIAYVGGKLVVEADRPMTPLEFLPRHLGAWSVGHLSPSTAWLGWSALLFLGLIIAALLLRKTAAGQPGAVVSGVPALLVLWLVPTCGIFLVGLYAPFTDARIERQLLFVLPFFLMLAAVGTDHLFRRSAPLAVAVVAVIVLMSLVSLSGFYTLPRYPGEDYRPLLADVNGMQGSEDGWLAIYEWQVGYLRAYLPDAHPRATLIDTALAEQPAELDSAVAQLLSAHPRVWLPAYQVKGRLFEEQIASSLAAQGITARDDWYGNTRLYLYGRSPTASINAFVTGEYPDIGAVNAAVEPARLTSGTGLVPVFMHASNGAASARVSLQLVGRGSVWGEWDGAFSAGMIRAGLPVGPGTPPGPYEVRATVYDGETGSPYRRTEWGIPVAPEMRISTVTVERPDRPLSPLALQRLADVSHHSELADVIRWLGATIPETPFLQGDVVPVTLFWQSLQPTATAARVFIQGFDASGELKINHEQPPVNGTFALPQWQPGDLVRDPHRVQLPADLAAGTYRLVAGLYDPATGARLRAPDGRDALELGTIEVGSRERMMDEPDFGSRLNIPFGGRVELARALVEGDPRNGDPLELTLVWRSRQTAGAPLAVFAQLYRGDTQLYSSDHRFDPPSTAWIDGEYIIDRHSIPALVEGPGEYRLIVGVYDAESGGRLSTSEGESFTLMRWE